MWGEDPRYLKYFSDDLEMKAIADNFPIGEASVRSIQAGCDLLLICHSEARQREGIDALKKALDQGALSPERLDQSLARIDQIW